MRITRTAALRLLVLFAAAAMLPACCLNKPAGDSAKGVVRYVGK